MLSPGLKSGVTSENPKLLIHAKHQSQSSSSAGNFHLEFLFLRKPGLTHLFKNWCQNCSSSFILVLQAEHILRKTSHIVNGGRISRGKIDASNSATLSQRKVIVLPCDGKVREKMPQTHTSLEEEQKRKMMATPNHDDIPGIWRCTKRLSKGRADSNVKCKQTQNLRSFTFTPS